jgi:hypothetical protein
MKNVIIMVKLDGSEKISMKYDFKQFKTRISTLEIHFLFFTLQGGAEKSMNQFCEGTYPPQGRTKQSTPLRGVGDFFRIFK